jgi:tetratricopeptide (TPR) repeat protein
MGKTRLLAEIAARARETGALTLAAGCFEQEGQLPYGPLHDALLDYLRTQPEGVVQAQLGDLMPDLGRIVPELRARFASAGEPGSREPEGQRLRLFAAVAQAFERIAAHLPLLLLLDDLHSADDATLQALHFLLRQPVSACVIVVGAYRPEEVATSSVLADIVAGAGYPPGAHPEGPRRIHTLSLAPLSDAEMAVLLKMRLRGRCAESLVRSVQEWSEGNPLFALEMVGLLEQEARLERLDDGWSLRAGMRIDLPRAVRDMMARHLRRLRPETRRALALGSVLGRAFDHATLAALWEGDPISLFEALDEAREAALLTESDGRYAFRHPLLRETVYDAITAPQRSLLHGQAGLAIEEISSSAAGASARRDYESELAHHFVAAAGYPLGGPLGPLGATFNERAVRYSILAGKAAENVFAYNQAAQHYRAALRLCRLLGDPSREAEALERLAALARTSAQGGEALELLAQAHRIYRELADDDGQARVMAQMGWEHYNRGTPEEGLAQLESALPELERHSSPSALASLYVSLSCLFRGRERHDESLVAAQRATELARAAGDDRLLTLARGREGMALSMMGREDEALRLFEEVIPRADMEGDLDTLERALYNAADVRLYRGEPHKSKEYQERALRVAEQMGDLRTMARVMASLAHSAFVLGEWDLAGKYADRACTLIPSGYPACALSSASPLCMAGELHLAQGQTHKASRCLEQSVALARRLGDSVVECLAQRALAECDLVWGHPEAAQARLEPLLDRPGQEEISVRPLLPVLAAAYLQTQDLDRAEKYALTAVRRARQPHYRCALVDALRIQGMVLTRRGRTAEARQALDDALSLARATPYPYGEARTLHAYGLIDLREKPEEARRQLEDALTIFRRLGAHPDIERVEAVLGLEKQARNH